mmetsp:Transcript_26461/g.80268  ORF Transcript_26461/g.80268 Transcript_26461/m.80268 type:complete len:341 (+) Transcript_26461:536-1558(+)
MRPCVRRQDRRAFNWHQSTQVASPRMPTSTISPSSRSSSALSSPIVCLGLMTSPSIRKTMLFGSYSVGSLWPKHQALAKSLQGSESLAMCMTSTDPLSSAQSFNLSRFSSTLSRVSVATMISSSRRPASRGLKSRKRGEPFSLSRDTRLASRPSLADSFSMPKRRGASRVNWSSIGASEFVSLFTRNQMFGFVLDDVTAPGLLALIAVPSPQRALALRGSLELLMLSTRSVSSSSSSSAPNNFCISRNLACCCRFFSSSSSSLASSTTSLTSSFALSASSTSLPVDEVPPPLPRFRFPPAFSPGASSASALSLAAMACSAIAASLFFCISSRALRRSAPL